MFSCQGRDDDAYQSASQAILARGHFHGHFHGIQLLELLPHRVLPQLALGIRLTTPLEVETLKKK